MDPDRKDASTRYPDTKKVFWKQGACSSTLLHIVNRELGHPQDAGERAAAPLAGGMMMRGRQCGMLWGATLGAGAEARRREPDRGRAIALAVAAAQDIVKSFTARTRTVSCREYTHCNWRNPFGILKYLVSGGIPLCFNLADDWAPEAVAVIRDALARAAAAPPAPALSCASEVALKMGVGDELAVAVAGFAGGIGLSGDGCGALGAAIWLRSLPWCQERPGKKPLSTPGGKLVLKSFLKATGGRLLCREITGRVFDDAGAHSRFVREEGCAGLIALLAGQHA
jgi:hypothetical protein